MPKNAEIEVDRLESFSVVVDAFLLPLELSTIRPVTTPTTLRDFRSPKRNPFCLSSDQSDPSSAAYTGEKVITSNAIINKYFILTPYHHLTLTVPLSSTSPITSFLDCILVILTGLPLYPSSPATPIADTLSASDSATMNTLSPLLNKGGSSNIFSVNIEFAPTNLLTLFPQTRLISSI